jgi:hypothetical protein
MTPEQILAKIQSDTRAGNYFIKSHVVLHSFEEGFEEKHIREAIQNSRILEIYLDQERCLLCGAFNWSVKRRDYMHVVAEYGNENYTDFITAYIPKRAEWETPFRRRTT